ncbi:MAG: hypothetical protein KIT10_14235 [Flavobacteriales bacterium]|nr:hypothetical protein [Flavobacteriales bacterium]
MMRLQPFAIALLGVLLLAACKKDDPAPVPPPVGGDPAPRLILKFKFDSTQVRLNNVGQVVGIPAGHGAQHPKFQEMSAHYVEFAPSAFTALGAGSVVYHAPETNAGGATAIDFSQSVRVGDGGTFLSIPLTELSAGTYQWLRVSLAYQKYDVRFRHVEPGFPPFDMNARLASFIGYNTWIGTFQVAQQSVAVNANKLQGFWASEVLDPPIPVPVLQGQAPPGATTVPNPIFATSPIPAGSCVVTGAFAEPLVITGSETSDVVITVSLSTNNSFEWVDVAGDGIFEPGAGDTVVDMGVRGMVPIVH